MFLQSYIWDFLIEPRLWLWGDAYVLAVKLRQQLIPETMIWSFSYHFPWLYVYGQKACNHFIKTVNLDDTCVIRKNPCWRKTFATSFVTPISWRIQGLLLICDCMFCTDVVTILDAPLQRPRFPHIKITWSLNYALSHAWPAVSTFGDFVRDCRIVTTWTCFFTNWWSQFAWLFGSCK